jgi:phosphoribosylanthranilate isomerase
MLKLKVCGMRSTENIRNIIELPIGYLGYIFYEKSARYVAHVPLLTLPKQIQKVGVFVNSGIVEIVDKVKRFDLQAVQLHGDETINECTQLKQRLPKIKLIKAFGIYNDFDWDQLMDYEGIVDFFLFDTKGKRRGGNGVKFDWEILNLYSLETPFWLSGGISLEDIVTVKKLAFEQLYGVDVNSQFEDQPGLKNVEKIKALTNELYH